MLSDAICYWQFDHWHLSFSVKWVPGCKVSLLVWSIFIGQNADLTSGLDCTRQLIISCQQKLVSGQSCHPVCTSTNIHQIEQIVILLGKLRNLYNVTNQATWLLSRRQPSLTSSRSPPWRAWDPFEAALWLRSSASRPRSGINWKCQSISLTFMFIVSGFHMNESSKACEKYPRLRPIQSFWISKPDTEPN